MASETLEDKKAEEEATVEDKEGSEAVKEGNKAEDPEKKGVEHRGEEEKEQKEQESKGIGESEVRNVEEKGEEVKEEEEGGKDGAEKEETVEEEEKDEEEEKEGEAEEEEEKEGEEETDDEEVKEDEEAEVEASKKSKGGPKGSSKKVQSRSKRPRQDPVDQQKSKKRVGKKGRNNLDTKEPVTPASERPTRERKTVERYSAPSPGRSGRSSASKALSIEKGRGAQLKDIPNVAFKLSKRKLDDNLQILHTILFGKKAKAHSLKRNIGQFSGFVWVENEEKQRAKVKEKLDKCVKEKLVDFCDVLNIPINKANVKKEELSGKLLEFLESPHVTTNVLLADKEQKGQKRRRKVSPSKSAAEGSTETPAKKQKQTPIVGKKRKLSSEVEKDEDADKAEHSDAKDDFQEDHEGDSTPNDESDHEESKSQEEEEDKPKAPASIRKTLSKKIPKEGADGQTGDKSTPIKKGKTAKATMSPKKSTTKSTSEKSVPNRDTASASLSKSKGSASKKQKIEKENKRGVKEKSTSKKQTNKSNEKLSAKDQGKSKSSKKAKKEPSREEMHAVVVDILKEVDFNTATLSDILRQLGTHFGLDLMHRKAEVKDIITDVINSMSDEEDEEEEDEENPEAGDADQDDDDDDA
ncbi:Protein DEK [Quillaja saponaria]|uniref:Protein DEK n=1 Tax=Quillaja saponaria TaxID=32244 RepID=A0AAD7P859_QUISA|nr:Protein DEK [Quillaja saponaria]